jgi:hypothetical protein
MQKHSDFYFTSDLGIAVYLFPTGHSLDRTELIGPQRLLFHFQKRENTEHEVARYLSGQAQAPARRLFENYRALRALAFEKTGNL